MNTSEQITKLAERWLGFCDGSEDWCEQHQSWCTDEKCDHMMDVITMMRRAYIMGRNA